MFGSSLKKLIEGNLNKKVMSNSLWMMSEKIVSIFGLIFVVSYVAKYVGPTVFGQIALATSLFQIIMIIAQLGSDVIIFKRINRNHLSGVKLINATLPLRAFIYLALSAPVFLFFYYSGDKDGLVFLLACLVSCLFMSIDAFSMYFDATLNSKMNTISNVIGLVFSLSLRWLIVYLNGDKYLLAIPIALTGLIPLVIRMFVFFKENKEKPSNFKNKMRYQKYLLITGASFVVSSLSVAIYTRVSMILLGYMDGSSSAGVFSVSVTLATSWSFILNSFLTSNLPSIFSEKNDHRAMKNTARVNLLVIFISVFIISFIFVFGGFIISNLYGDGYYNAYTPLIILSFSTMISSLGTISARFIARYSGYSFLSKKMLCVAFFSISINIPLIYFYGLTGAAIATLITEIISLTIFNYFFKKGIVLRVHILTIFFKKTSK